MVLAIWVQGLHQGMVAVGDELTQVQFQILKDLPNIRLKVVWGAQTHTHFGLHAKLTQIVGTNLHHNMLPCRIGDSNFSDLRYKVICMTVLRDEHN